MERRVLIPEHDSTPLDVGGFYGAEVLQFGGQTMGTTWTMKVVRENEIERERIERIAEGALALVVAQMSPWEPESDLSRYRRAKTGTWVSFSDESYGVLVQSLEVSGLTEGVYDPRVGEVIDLLGFGPSERGEVEIKGIRKMIGELGRKEVFLEAEGKRVYQPGGVQLDLCSIAKGFAVDLIAERLKGAGLNHFLIEVGGEIRGEGCKPDGQPWWCLLASPEGSEDSLQETIAALCGLAVATSGNSLRKRQVGGAEVGHIVSGNAMVKLDEEMLSVSVFNESCMAADAFATALYALGSEKGKALAEQLGLAVLFVRKTGEGFEERWTTAFAQMMKE